jgi:hypothetical protein
MQIAPHISFEGSESSDAARDVIIREIARLETHNQRITGCRITVIAPSQKHRHGTGFQVHILLTIPPHENIVVDNSAYDDARHEHPVPNPEQTRAALAAMPRNAEIEWRNQALIALNASDWCARRQLVSLKRAACKISVTQTPN